MDRREPLKVESKRSGKTKLEVRKVQREGQSGFPFCMSGGGKLKQADRRFEAQETPAVLALDDGTLFRGRSIGASGTSAGGSFLTRP
jgi:hypothetical protein